MVSVMEATVEAPSFPKWYIEAPIEDSPRGRLVDRVRTALVDYPHPEHIVRIYYGCVAVELISPKHFESVVEHLDSRGDFKFHGGSDAQEYIALSEGSGLASYYDRIFMPVS